MRTLVPVVSVALVLGACTESLAPSPDEGSVPSTPATSASPLTTVAEFVGAYDPTTGELTIEPLPVEEWRFADHGAHRMVRQGGVIENAHGYCNDLPVGRNGVRLNTVNGSLGLTVADCIPEPGRSFWGSFVYSDGAFCATVRLTNDTGKRLYNPVAEIIEITSGYEAYQYIDTGSDPPCCGTGADVAALPTGPQRPVDITGGVFQWADVNTGASSDQKWTFRNGGGPLRFRGRVVAQIHEIDNGLDDDCDGVVDNLLGEFPDGAACRVDRDCSSGVCSSGVCGISCGPGTYGPACEACADCGPHGACDEGATGTGACMCDPGYAGGACDDCSNGRFGPSCELCPSCGVNGACDEGIAGGGACVCDIGFHGAECQYSCSNGIQDGDEEGTDCGGSCVLSGACLPPPPEIGPGQSIVASRYSTCAIRVDGLVKCWGVNNYGQSGVGNTYQYGDNPGELVGMPTVNLGPGRTATSLGAGMFHHCAVMDNGTVGCWGANYAGQLGNGQPGNHWGDASNEHFTPVIPISFGAASAVSVVAGEIHSCALLDDGAVKCWGYAGHGQLGGGNTTQIVHPGQILSMPPVNLGSGRTAVGIAAGLLHTCALLDNGSVRCWGYNGYGQLGTGNTQPYGHHPGVVGDAIPLVNLGAGRTAVAISAGLYSTCALLDNGAVRCWGLNNYGQLGTANTQQYGHHPSLLGDAIPTVDLGTGRTAVALARGWNHTCAILDNGAVRCWGYNGHAQLGTGNTQIYGVSPSLVGDAIPTVNLGTGRSAVGLTGGELHTCAALDDGSYKCWGLNPYGQLGQGDTQMRGHHPSTLGDALLPINLGGPT